MHASFITKWAVFCVTVSMTQAATIELRVTIRDDTSSNLQSPTEREFNTNRLLLRDCPSYPFTENAVDHIRAFIVEKLNLPHLEWRILQALYTDKGLMFEMASPSDAEEILNRFAVKLRNKDCILKTTGKEFFN